MVILEPIKHRVPIAKPKIGVAGKTGSWRWMKPVVDVNKCTRCFLCEIYCPDNTIKVDPEKGPTIDYDYCKGCGVCAQVCPSKAIEMVNEEV
ncbi:4Fe-4S binding protein [Desulfurococcaceae archaeon MEX13E-LK6-19]|nr:4Fe-4S binding protein [Desulfurococcaceae archaeon MEX13E-LK6-19]